MAGLRNLVPGLDRLYGIPGKLGLSQWSFTVRVRVWTGARAGLGSFVDEDVPLKVDRGQQNPRVERLSAKDVVASGGEFTDAQYRIGPIAPGTTYRNPITGQTSTVGHLFGDFNPSKTSSSTEVFLLLSGPGLPSGYNVCKKIREDTITSLGWYITVQTTGERLS